MQINLGGKSGKCSSPHTTPDTPRRDISNIPRVRSWRCAQFHIQRAVLVDQSMQYIYIYICVTIYTHCPICIYVHRYTDLPALRVRLTYSSCLQHTTRGSCARLNEHSRTVIALMMDLTFRPRNTAMPLPRALVKCDGRYIWMIRMIRCFGRPLSLPRTLGGVCVAHSPFAHSQMFVIAYFSSHASSSHRTHTADAKWIWV